MRVLLALLLILPPPPTVRAAELELVDRLTSNGPVLLRSSATWSGVAPQPLSEAGRGGIYFETGTNKFKISENGGAYFNLLGGYWGQTGTLIHAATLSNTLALGRSDILTGTLLAAISPVATPSLFVQASNGRVGVGTSSPGQTFDVEGAAQFGDAGTKSLFGAAGSLTLAASAGVTLSGANGNYTSGSSVTASAFFGSGAALTGVTGTDSTRVLKAGDTMTGTLTLTGASANIISGSSITANGCYYGDASQVTAMNASNFASGNVPSARLNGSYTGITGVGTLTVGTWNATLLGVIYGGTGAANATGARSNLSAAVSGSNNDITALTTLAAGGLADATVYGQDIANSTITLNKLNASGCSPSQIAAYNGTVWTCAADGTNDTTKVLKIGDTMTGALTMSGAAAYISGGSSITTSGGYFGNAAGVTALNASSFASGTVPAAQVSGSYTGVTGLGTLTAGTWNATPVVVLYGGTGGTSASTARTGIGLSATGSTQILDHTGSYTSIDLSGSNNSYAGLAFNDVTGGRGQRLMIHTTGDKQGFYHPTNGWSWFFENGILSSGTVNASQIVGTVASASTATNLSGGAMGSIPYQSGVGVTSMLAAGTAGYLLTGNGAVAPIWSGTLAIPGFVSLTGAADPAGNLRFSAANPYIVASSYIRFPGGLDISGGTAYFANQLQARGGIHNDQATYLRIDGGTSGISYFSGRLGIGTTSPGTLLHVSSGIARVDGTGGYLRSNRLEAVNLGFGDTYLTTEDGSLPGYAGSFYPTLRADSGVLYISIGGLWSGYISGGELFVRRFTDFDDSDYFVDPSGESGVSGTLAGKIGLGVYPNAMLHAYGDSQTTYGVYDTPLRLQGDTHSFLEFVTSLDQAGVLYNRNGSQGWLAGLNNGGSFRISTMSAISQTGLTNAKDGVEGLTMGTNGYLGVNQGTPTANLHVRSNNQNGLVIDDGGVTGDGINTGPFTGLGFQYDYGNGDSAVMSSLPSGTAYLSFWTTSGTMSEKMRLTGSGQLVINATSPGTAKFYVQDLDNNSTADIAQFYANNLTQGIGFGYNRIEALGSNTDQHVLLMPKGGAGVGVGMTPSCTLHVTGNIGVSGWVGAGCEGGCESSGGYTLMYADGYLIVNPGTGNSPVSTLGLYMNAGSLPGYPTGRWPTVKTDYSYIYFGINGAYASAMASNGTLYPQSTRAKKENFTAPNKEKVLDQIRRLEVSRWSYKDQDPAIRHIGPIAESFYEQFGLNGEDDTMISHIDPPGVALVGIQGLIERVRSRQERIESLKAAVAELRLAAGLEEKGHEN